MGSAAVLRSIRIVAMLIPFLWLAGLYWPRSLDDAFITAAYAAEWLSTGTLRWTSGDVVEGYSHPTWLLLFVASLAAHLDPILIGKIGSLVAGVAMIIWLGWRAPMAPAATLSIFALSIWTPFAHWSSLGMETTAFALLLAVGWSASWEGRHALATTALALAALTRPEGHLFWAIAVLRAFADRDRTVATCTVVGLAVYHGVRVEHFGAVWPTPFLVKVMSHGAATRTPASQLGAEGLSAAGVMATLVLWRAPGRLWLWAALPLAVFVAVLFQIRGDWMGWGRILLPGVVALLACIATAAQPRGSLGAGWVVAPLTLLGLFEPTSPDRGPRMVNADELTHPTRRWREASTPNLTDDMAWALEHVPDGATILAADVGLLGNVPGVRVRDIAGLVDREIANQRARGDADEATWRTAYGPQSGRIGFVRIPRWQEGTSSIPDWMADALPLHDDLLPPWGVVRWFHIVSPAVPTSSVLARWSALRARFPSQPWFLWRELLARAAAGQDAHSLDLERPERSGFAALDAGMSGLSFTHASDFVLEWAPGLGFTLAPGASLQSRPLGADEIGMARLEIAAPRLTNPTEIELQWSDACAPSTLRVEGSAEAPLAPVRSGCAFTGAVILTVANAGTQSGGRVWASITD